MREILFRGKAINTNNEELLGKWIFGQLVVRRDHDEGEEKTFICESGYRFIRCLNKMPRTFEVNPSTVGQYTGLIDKYGKQMIFEGDIVSTVDSFPRTYIVEYDDGRAGWFPFACGDGCGCCEEDTISPAFSKIIGNIHDNPELIKEEKHGHPER